MYIMFVHNLAVNNILYTVIRAWAERRALRAAGRAACGKLCGCHNYFTEIIKAAQTAYAYL